MSLFFQQGKLSIKAEFLIALLGLVGLTDAIYLTIHHYTAKPVPCSLVDGCEKVLTSDYAVMFGMPIALFGAVAYLSVIILALLSASNKRFHYLLFIQTAAMAIVSAWLIYIQAFIIESFCQFCLLSAAVSFTLFAISLFNLAKILAKSE